MISIVVPVRNEQESLLELHRSVSCVMSTVDIPFELVFVDDGSTDRSLEIMLGLSEQHRNVKVLELSRNFGHQLALAAGLDYASGDAVITMDCDLQHPPELIPRLIERWQDGYDIVYTRRRRTADTGLLKRITARLFYAVVSRLSGIDIPQGAADFRLVGGNAVQALRAIGERAVFLRGLVRWIGYRQTVVFYEAHARLGGKSKYGLMQMLRFAAEGITSFSSLPLYISAVVGMIISAFAFLYAGFAIYARLFTDRTVEGWASVLAALLFLGGLQLVALGIQGAYLGRIYSEVKGRPRYLVRQTYGFD